MKVTQVATIVNTVTGEILGRENPVQEDLSNIVDIGREVFDATSVDNYVKKLINHIGKVVFVNRVYRGNAPSVLMDGWEYGSVLEKVRMDLPEATENESWKLEDKQVYEQDTFYQPKISAKFFNSKVTFEIPMSFAERQVKESFSNGTQLNAFFSMIYNGIERSMDVKTDALIMRTINNFIAETFYAEKETLGEQWNTASGVRAINLLKLYNDKFKQELTSGDALTSPDFIRFASYIMGLYVDRLSKISTLFNIGGTDKFTPKEYLHVIMLSDFAKAADTYLQSDVYHDAYTKLPNYETVPYWQGSGTNYDFDSVSAINVKVNSTDGAQEVSVKGVLGCMFDRDALGVANIDRRVTSHYNARAEFFNNWYKYDAGYFNDLNENMIVFYVA